MGRGLSLPVILPRGISISPSPTSAGGLLGFLGRCERTLRSRIGWGWDATGRGGGGLENVAPGFTDIMTFSTMASKFLQHIMYVSEQHEHI